MLSRCTLVLVIKCSCPVRSFADTGYKSLAGFACCFYAYTGRRLLLVDKGTIALQWLLTINLLCSICSHKQPDKGLGVGQRKESLQPAANINEIDTKGLHRR